MKILSKEKTRALAERTGWSLARAEGFIDGEMFRRRGKAPSAYARVGIDEYSQGFRAGYYERSDRGGIPGEPVSGTQLGRVTYSRSKEHVDAPLESGVVSIQGG